MASFDRIPSVNTQRARDAIMEPITQGGRSRPWEEPRAPRGSLSDRIPSVNADYPLRTHVITLDGEPKLLVASEGGRLYISRFVPSSIPIDDYINVDAVKPGGVVRSYYCAHLTRNNASLMAHSGETFEFEGFRFTVK